VKRVGTLLSCLMLLVALGPLTILGGILGVAGYRGQVAREYRYAQSLAANAGSRMERLLERLADDVLSVDRFQDYFSLPGERRRDILLELMAQSGAFRELVLVDGGGAQLARVSSFTAHSAQERRDLSGDPLFMAAVKGHVPVFGEVGFDPVVGEPTMPMAVPFLDPRTGKPRGAVICSLGLSFLMGLVDELSEPPALRILVTSYGGRVIAAPDLAMVLSGSRYSPEPGPVVQAGAQGGEAIPAVHRLGVGDGSLAVVAELDAGVAMRPFWDTARVYSLVFLAAMVLAALLAVYGKRRIADPIRRLTAAARAIRNGDLNARAPGEGLAETRELAGTFNDMTSRLLETLKGLEAEAASREEAQKALKVSQERLDLALDAVSDGVWDWRVDTGSIYYSPRWFTMLGYEPGSLPPEYSTWRGLVHPDDIGGAEAKVRDHMASGQPFEMEFRMLCADGGWKWILARGKVVEHAPDGSALRMVGTHVDITERRRMQEIMVQTEKIMSVGGLAAGMAHEINNPLSGIAQCAQVLAGRLETDSRPNRQAASEAGCDLEKVWGYVSRREIPGLLGSIREAAARAGRIVSNMLEFSRKSESGDELCDLNHLLDESVVLSAADFDLKKKYDFKRIQIKRQYEAGLPPVSCSRTQVEQVMLNLIKNATQALALGTCDGRPPRITLRTASDGGGVRFEVEDNGPGMDEEVRRKVFEPFFTTKPVGEGTGLGLSVSFFIIVSNHGGLMEVDSAPGKGTRFTARLPVKPASSG